MTLCCGGKELFMQLTFTVTYGIILVLKFDASTGANLFDFEKSNQYFRLLQVLENKLLLLKNIHSILKFLPKVYLILLDLFVFSLLLNTDLWPLIRLSYSGLASLCSKSPLRPY